MLLLRLRVGRRCGGGVDGGESFWSVEAANSYSGATRSLGACLVFVCVCVCVPVWPGPRRQKAKLYYILARIRCISNLLRVSTFQ